VSAAVETETLLAELHRIADEIEFVRSTSVNVDRHATIDLENFDNGDMESSP